MTKSDKHLDVLGALAAKGGLRKGAAAEIAGGMNRDEARVYGAGSFYHLLNAPDVDVRVCTGLSCKIAGADDTLAALLESGVRAAGCGCLAACDQAPATMKGRQVAVTAPIVIGPSVASPDTLVIDLLSPQDLTGAAFAAARKLGADKVIAELDASGLVGRGGAGFPAARKWNAVRSQADTTRYVVLNADEGEPGTFKDRDVLRLRPDRVLEGLAIAAHVVGATDVYCYIRGEFVEPKQALVEAIEAVHAAGVYGDIRFHTHDGHGAYICGEETALLEALEGKRGMPRLRPPYPAEKGLWGRPTLVHNVETIACLPAIVARGAEWFRSLGKTGPGTKLYSVSGHLHRPGTYELPLGVSLDELVEHGGGYVGELKAFSPGGAASGFLPARERTRALDFDALREVGTSLGSAGVVVLNDTVSMADAARWQMEFFEAESCGQCAPCRIGCGYLRKALEKFGAGDGAALRHTDDVAWEMEEGSICGLGQAAPVPMTSAMRWFPEEFGR